LASGSEGQTWATFITNHRADIWVYDVRFAPIFAFFMIELDRVAKFTERLSDTHARPRRASPFVP